MKICQWNEFLEIQFICKSRDKEISEGFAKLSFTLVVTFELPPVLNKEAGGHSLDFPPDYVAKLQVLPICRKLYLR